MTQPRFRSSLAVSVFDPVVFDVVVVGSGYAGWAAALATRRTGARVLLIGEHGDLVWESGRSFSTRVGHSPDSSWQRLVSEVSARTGANQPDPNQQTLLDGAIAEVVATELLRSSGVEVLYYARPAHVEHTNPSATTSPDGLLVDAIQVATKAGLRRVRARQWIDATETAVLARLTDPAARPRTATAAEIQLYLQHADWNDVERSLGGAAPWRATGWPTERVHTVQVDPSDAAWRITVPAALQQLADLLGDTADEVSLSHLSFQPMATRFEGNPQCALPANLAVASPVLAPSAPETIGQRIDCGVSAAAALAHLRPAVAISPVATPPAATSPAATPPAELRSVQAATRSAGRTLVTDVCVVGVGTGGALAALAAARVGRSVIAVDPASFVGGIGTGGGIHTYSYGVPGGLQAEVDTRTRSLMRAHGKGFLGDGPFNPWAKMITLEQMLRDQGVDLILGSQAYQAECDRGRVTAVWVATPDGPLRIEAASFVDGTGDGDLSAMAGADFTLGREQDGLPHAYSQSSGKLKLLHRRPRMTVVNFDAGFCDPTDPEDLTRARLVGIGQYLLPSYDNLSRPTYIAPAVGLRQGRQIITRYVLTLNDQITGRRFRDPIGYTASHYENHASDCEFESDESMFWVWANRQWSTPIGCDLPYRMLVPRGIDNVWLASRCAGVSQDAHHATRMQRDLQRLGEAAGYAAALAARRRDDPGADQLTYAELRTWLDRSGALERKERRVEPVREFGRIGAISDTGGPLPSESPADWALATLDAGVPGRGTWWLARHPKQVRDAVLARLELLHPGRTEREQWLSWLAAGVVAMWRDAAAEVRLLDAVRSREYGFGDSWPWAPSGYNAPRTAEAGDPLSWKYVVPNWLCAIGLLRLCGTEACLEPLAELLEQPVHGLNTVTTTALTLTRLITDGRLPESSRTEVIAMAERLGSVAITGAVDNPRRHTGRHSELALRKAADEAPREAQLRPVDQALEDSTWQASWAVSRLRMALGLGPTSDAQRLIQDDRILVRRAFSRLVTGQAEAGGS